MVHIRVNYARERVPQVVRRPAPFCHHPPRWRGLRRRRMDGGKGAAGPNARPHVARWEVLKKKKKKSLSSSVVCRTIFIISYEPVVRKPRVESVCHGNARWVSSPTASDTFFLSPVFLYANVPRSSGHVVCG